MVILVKDHLKKDSDLIFHCRRPCLIVFWVLTIKFISRFIVYSYFMPVCSIVKTITPRCRGRPDALLHEAQGRVHISVHVTEGS